MTAKEVQVLSSVIYQILI